MNVYLDKKGFVHLRKSKNRAYIGQFLGEAKEEGKVEILLSPKLSEKAYDALSNARIEKCAIEE